MDLDELVLVYQMNHTNIRYMSGASSVLLMVVCIIMFVKNQSLYMPLEAGFEFA